MLSAETQFINQNIDMFCCPKCQGGLKLSDNKFYCNNCGHSYLETEGIPTLFCANNWGISKEDVTEEIKLFYEETPFPNYDEFDNVGSLLEKARKGIFVRLLDEQVPYMARVLECGCGTGQLTNYLSVANRTVIGTDMCLNSLKMAQEFKDKNNLERAHFYQMNLFRPCFKPNIFDLVICNGVLHHTSDPYLGFKSISSLVKPNGYILIGLYHKYGRIITDFRRLIFNLTKDNFKFLDIRSVNEDISLSKRNAWFMDQYKNPHESKHKIEEVLTWLDKTGFTFVKAIPKTVLFENFQPSEKLFKPDKLGNWFERFIVNIDMMFKGGDEGGFFITIAKKIKA